REVRIGERRAGLHADGHGAERHVEDRWATVHRSGPEPAGPAGRRRAPDNAPGGGPAEPTSGGWESGSPSGGWDAGPPSGGWETEQSPGGWESGPPSGSWDTGPSAGRRPYGPGRYDSGAHGARGTAEADPGEVWATKAGGPSRRRHERDDRDAELPYPGGSHHSGGSYRSAARHGDGHWR
ncbi:hypothetical protein GSF22_28795, partial [Micromonospora echinofusca]|nr:hypothetical protein [Micromonospora echinofusca]